jgi:hypothetical protein
MSELAQIMREAGLSTGNADKIRVEHVFIVEVSEKADKIAKALAVGLLELGHHVAESFRIFAMAGSAAIILWGTSQLITSFRRKQIPNAT